MAERRSCNGLIIAGLVVTLIGLVIVVTRHYQIPREWTTVGVGLALVAAGAARRMLRDSDGS